jgi:N6-L-threonylcarbamoyladenine synthase
MRILGIETSCDETAVSICELQNGVVNMLSNSIVSQIDIHKVYGGVVPEVAARSHIEAMIPTLDESIKQAFGIDKIDVIWDDIDAIAVTYGAGLGGALLIGALTAKTLAVIKQKPLYACNHVEGHVYANFVTSTVLDGYSLPKRTPEFPLLALIVSGKHSQLVLFRNHFDYTILGKTYDDAIGEAFDKVAKMTGLPYPGGPSVAKAAINGDPYAFDLPRPHMEGPYDSSFSGLKTAVLRKAQFLCGRDFRTPSFELPSLLSEAQVNDIAAVFQRTAIETMVSKMVQAYEEFSPRDVVIAGGVASSQELRRQLSTALPIEPLYTDPKLCTDNGAMIAALGCFKVLNGVAISDPFTLEIQPSLKM